MDRKEENRKKILKALMPLVFLVVLGVILLVAGREYNLFIPCLFHEVTGFYCPGCGISHMFVALSEGDFQGAWSYNPAVIMALPLLVYYTGRTVLNRWPREMSKKISWSKKHNFILYFMILYFILFGILRNFPLFS